MGDSIFITEVVIGLIVLWLMPPANGWSMKTSTWPFSYTFCGVLNINDNMASKQKKAGKIYRKNQKKITEQKSRNWTDLETEEFCRVLADPDSDFCLTLEKKALKKTANKDSNKEVFEAIQAELKTKIQNDELKKFNQLYSDVGDDSRARVQTKTNLSSTPFALLNNNCKNQGTSMMICLRAPFKRILSSSTSPRLVTLN